MKNLVTYQQLRHNITYLGENYKCLASFGHIREIRSLKDIDETNGFK